MDSKIEMCPVCGISRINGVFHYSYRNTTTTNADVAGVICKNILNVPVKVSKCINPDKFDCSGDSFAKRTQHQNNA